MGEKQKLEREHRKWVETKKAKKKKRGEAIKSIITRLKKGPAYTKQLSDELGIEYNTVKYNLKNLKDFYGLVIKLSDGRYAWETYNSEEEKVKLAYNKTSKLLLRPPKPEEIAYSIRERPEDARSLLFKYIPGYYVPTEEEITKAADKVWNLMSWGMEQEYEKVPGWHDKKAWFRHIDWDAFWNYVIEDYKGMPPVSLEEARLYLKECPEMKPKIIGVWKGEELYVEAVWEEEALIYVRKFPKYNDGFFLP